VLPLMLEPFPFMSSCFFQGTVLLPIIISLQKLLFLSFKELQLRSWQHREGESEKHRPRRGSASLPGLDKTGFFTTGLQTHHLQEPLFVQQMCGKRHFLSFLCFLEPAGNGGNIGTYSRWKQVIK